MRADTQVRTETDTGTHTADLVRQTGEHSGPVRGRHKARSDTQRARAGCHFSVRAGPAAGKLGKGIQTGCLPRVAESQRSPAGGPPSPPLPQVRSEL